jgi:hypothetical protein
VSQNCPGGHPPAVLDDPTMMLICFKSESKWMSALFASSAYADWNAATNNITASKRNKFEKQLSHSMSFYTPS